jgi:hypothetical protein
LGWRVEGLARLFAMVGKKLLGISNLLKFENLVRDFLSVFDVGEVGGKLEKSEVREV